MEDNVVPPQPMETTPPPVQEMSHQVPEQKQSGSKIYIVLIVVLLIILAAAGAYMMFGNKNGNNSANSGANMAVAPTVDQTQVQATSKINPAPTPVVSTMNTTNADQTLSTTDADLQQAVNQVNTDLNDLNKINPGQDSTSGL